MKRLVILPILLVGMMFASCQKEELPQAQMAQLQNPNFPPGTTPYEMKTVPTPCVLQRGQTTTIKMQVWDDVVHQWFWHTTINSDTDIVQFWGPNGAVSGIMADFSGGLMNIDIFVSPSCPVGDYTMDYYESDFFMVGRWISFPIMVQ